MAKISDEEGILLGCGNPLLDISANVETQLLEQFGMKPDDAIVAGERHMPLYQLLVEKYHAEYIAGGSVQNTLRVCQWLLQKRNACVFFGAVGNDKNADILAEKARSDGVNVQYQRVNKCSTGTCAVLITGTHRSLCANLAAANQFSVEHLCHDTSKAYIANAKYFYISGFFLSVSPPSCLELAQHALKHDRPFMMNLSAPFISQYYMKDLEAALPYVDILFGNETEAVSFSKEQGWPTENLEEIGERLAVWPKLNEQRKRVVVLTQGQHPVLIFNGNAPVQEFAVHCLEPSEVIDTNGAGDAFVGGFLSQYIQQKPLDTCARCGIWTAGEIIKRSGCTFDGLPTFH